MKYSVIIPVYNVSTYLDECVNSVLNQSFKEFEVILVDDGSTDESPQICDALAKKDERVKVIHQQNRGVVIARQVGVDMAKGEYLVFIDGDDTITPDCLQIVDEYSFVDVIRFGYNRETKNGIEKWTMPERKGLYNREQIVKEIFPKLIQTKDAKYFSPGVCGGVFRKELFEDNMLKDTRLAIGEDGACVIPCIYHAQSMYILENCLYNYRLNLASITKGKQVFQWNMAELIVNHLIAKMDINKYDFQEQIYRKIVHEMFSVVVSQFYRKEKVSIIKKDIKKHLDLPLYAEAIREAEFRHSFKASLMHAALKYKWFGLIRAYSRIK